MPNFKMSSLKVFQLRIKVVVRR